MAETKAQLEVAKWIRSHSLPEMMGGTFETRPVPLRSGGEYRFPIVDETARIVGAICTASAQTASGKNAVGKMNKVRADLYFLLLTEAEQKIVVVTEPSMHLKLLKERDELRRIPQEIRLLLVGLPAELRERLRESQLAASLEVTPA